MKQVFICIQSEYIALKAKIHPKSHSITHKMKSYTALTQRTQQREQNKLYRLKWLTNNAHKSIIYWQRTRSNPHNRGKAKRKYLKRKP